METQRQKEAFYTEAERIQQLVSQGDTNAQGLTSCQSVFQLGLQ